jgi:2-keto-3-deoxy-L-rhamnonate aldolase RhmA
VVNVSILIIPTIKTLEALEPVGETAVLDGVDSIFFRTNDFTAEMGSSGVHENPGVTEAYQRTINDCPKASGLALTGYTLASVSMRSTAMGANWIMAATDDPLLLSGATKRVGEMAVLNSKLVTTRQTSIKLAGASNAASAVPENLSEGLSEARLMELLVPSTEGL